MGKTRSRPARPRIPFGGKVSVVPRGLCRLERVWAPARNRQGIEAARLQAQQTLLGPGESLFAEPSKETTPGLVNIWICSGQDKNGRPVGEGIWLPETFLMEPGPDGPLLVSCAEGFEGQIWQSGSLLATRWWLSAPGEDAWQAFIGGVDAGPGLPPSDTVDWTRRPVVTKPAWRRTISVLSLGPETLYRMFAPPRLAALAALLLSLPMGYLVGSEAVLRQEAAGLAAARAQLTVQHEEIQAAQRTAFQARAYADAMAVNDAPTELIDALIELRRLANVETAEISFIRLADARLEVRLEGLRYLSK